MFPRLRPLADTGTAAAGEEFEEDEEADKSAARARQQATQLPDEYVPPNKILFLQQLPSSMTRDQLEALFGPYVSARAARMYSDAAGIPASTRCAPCRGGATLHLSSTAIFPRA